jgi:hypothetical protein
VAWELTACPRQNPTVSLNEPAKVPVTVVVKTVDDTAVAPSDYVALTGYKVTIPAGSLSAEIPVTIVDDGVKEPDERFFIKVVSTSVGRIDKDTATVTIKDGRQPAPCAKA